MYEARISAIVDEATVLGVPGDDVLEARRPVCKDGFSYEEREVKRRWEDQGSGGALTQKFEIVGSSSRAGQDVSLTRQLKQLSQQLLKRMKKGFSFTVKSVSDCFSARRGYEKQP